MGTKENIGRLVSWPWWIVVLAWILTFVVYAKVGLVLWAAEPQWEATAYCKGSTVAAGLPVKRGMAATDPRVIPTGSIVKVTGTGSERWDGVYHVLDTGPEIQGREIDLYMWSCFEALDFGRRSVKVEIIREGWMPNRLVYR